VAPIPQTLLYHQSGYHPACSHTLRGGMVFLLQNSDPFSRPCVAHLPWLPSSFHNDFLLFVRTVKAFSVSESSAEAAPFHHLRLCLMVPIHRNFPSHFTWFTPIKGLSTTHITSATYSGPFLLSGFPTRLLAACSEKPVSVVHYSVPVSATSSTWSTADECWLWHMRNWGSELLSDLLKVI
jgi:hypothetical protein